MLRVALTAIAAVLMLPATAEAQTRGARTTVAGLPPQATAQTWRDLSFAPVLPPAGGALVLVAGNEEELTARAATLDADTRGAVLRAMGAAKFRYGARASQSLRGIGAWDRILVVGTGRDADAAAMQRAGMVAGRALLSDEGPVTVLADGLPAERIADFATGFSLGEYRSDIHSAASRARGAHGPAVVVAGAATDAEALYRDRGRALVEAVAWARDISNEPANIVYPESFVDRARAAFAGVAGVTIEVLDVPAMERLGMGAILGVGRGSARPPRMMILRYRGAGAPDGGPVVLVGKGITFDTGGISIKPTANMGNMKMDMSGAASVTGAVLSLARSRAPVDVVAISALAENMPDGDAVRPGDVLRAMNGRTIEIMSTDAEGRLVLADALSYAQARLNPAAVIDVATLTGAINTALGSYHAGLFTRHDPLAVQIEAAAAAAGEPVWRMPLHRAYGDLISSPIADLRNGGSSGPGAGTGAYFVGEFVHRATPWAHLDIAGVAWTGSAGATDPAGSLAWGVRLLDRLVRDFQPIPPQAVDAEEDADVAGE